MPDSTSRGASVDDIRTSQRFPVQLPLTVTGEQPPSSGQTENISAGGVYLWVQEKMEVGSMVQFDISIPGEVVGGAEVSLHCNGRVVRCDADQQTSRTGVACVIEQYEFVRNAPSGGK